MARSAWDDWRNDVYGGGHDDMLEEIDNLREVLSKILSRSDYVDLDLSDEEIEFWKTHVSGTIEEAYPELYSDE